ncbi:MAG: TIGR04086 family membrane protein [Defluviitaleaceae bacterium]|nr:TIGR04086 family membrane protein [Defluviitaleaceae bacterium]
MADKLVRSIAKGVVFGSVSSLLVSVVITLLLYIEIVGVVLASKMLYGAFVVILFIASFITARNMGSRGLFVGLGIGCVLMLFGALYRFLGIETGVGSTFLIRGAVTLLVAIAGAVIGTNTVK